MEHKHAMARTIIEDKAAILSFLALVAVVVIFRGEIREKAHYLFLVYFIVLLVNRRDSRYSIGAALILLLFTAILLVQKKEAFANQIAIYAYYFLVVGVVLQLIEYIRGGGEKEEGMQENVESRRGREDKMPREKRGKPRFIAIASGKGGVGKTTLTANLGVALSSRGKRVVEVDMDIAMPNLEVIMGIKQPPVGLIDVINGRLNLKRVTYVGCDGVKVIPPGLILNGFTESNVLRIKAALGGVKDADYVLLDMPPGREAMRVLKQGHEMLLVVNPEKASVLDALNLKAIAEKEGLRVIGVVMNRVGGYPRELSVEEVEEALELEVLARIPEDERVMISYSEEVPFLLRYPGIAPSREVEGLAALLAGGERGQEEAQAEGGNTKSHDPKGFLRALIARLRRGE
jgi:septum site-determining protein MinD